MATQVDNPEPKPKLLFVDDEQRVLNSMRVMFRRDFELFLSSRGSDALEILDREDIDVIVADHRMPKMTGVEVLTWARNKSPRTVRILLTGYADLDAVEGSINESEVFRFLTKPCPPTELRATVELAARISRQRPAPEPPATLQPAIVEEQQEAAVELPAVAAQTEELSLVESMDRAQPEAPADDKWTRTMTDIELIATAVIERPPEIDGVEAEPSAAPPARARMGGLVVFSDDQTIVETVREATQHRVQIHVASNIVQVVRILSEYRPGVLITDISADRSTIQSMTANLKRHLPELVTIAISQHRDVLDMVWLINHGQIFRFLRKPLSAGRCSVSIQAALQHHKSLLRDSALVERHAVDDTADTGLISGMIDTIRAVRRLWA
jgi:serine/threonine-protein kinase